MIFFFFFGRNYIHIHIKIDAATLIKLKENFFQKTFYW